MKNNYFIIKIKYLLLVLFFAGYSVTLQAQYNNTGDMKLQSSTTIGVFFDYANAASGTVTNDGLVYIHEDFTNNGTVDFTNGVTTGTTYFSKASATQVVSGSGTTSFYNIEDEANTAVISIDLNKTISVANEFTFGGGIIDEGATGTDGLVVFNDNSSHTGVTDDAFVDGYVRKIGDDSFEFPIGDDDSGTYKNRPASIAAPSGTSDSYKARYIWENSNSTYVHTSKDATVDEIDNTEYWDIQQESGSGTPAITIGWDSSTTPASIFADTALIIVVRWDGSKWVNEGGTVDAANKTITATPSGYGVFTLATLVPTVLGNEDNNLASKFNVYPNPTEGVLYLQREVENIKVFDVLGKKLMDLDNTNEVDLTNCKIGMYYIMVKTERGAFTKKVIKK